MSERTTTPINRREAVGDESREREMENVDRRQRRGHSNSDEWDSSGLIKFGIFVLIAALVFFGSNHIERGREMFRECGDLPEFCEKAYNMASRLKSPGPTQTGSDRKR
jgi:hypothetical protein